MHILYLYIMFRNAQYITYYSRNIILSETHLYASIILRAIGFSRLRFVK